MLRNIGGRSWLAGWVLAGLVTLSQSLQAAEPRPLAEQLPEGSVIFAELSGLDPVIDRVQKSTRLQDYLASDLYSMLSKQPDVQKAIAGQKMAEAQAGMDLWTLSRTLLGGRVAVGLYPHEGRKQPDSVLILESPQPEKFQQLREKLEPLLLFAGDKVRRSDVAGVEMLDLDGKGFAANGKDWLVVGSDRNLVETTLKLRSGTEGKTVATQSYYQQAMASLGDGHVLRAAFDSAALGKAVAKERLAPEKANNVLASLLLQGVTELFATTPAAGIGIQITESQFAINVVSAKSPTQLDGRFNVFFGSLANVPNLQGLIFGASISRQYADWYNARDKFIEERLLPEFDKFEAGLGNLLPNRDFGGDVLPLFGPTISFVVAPQDLSHLDGKPGVVLPGFAIVTDLKKPEEGEAVAQLFFQTIASIANLNAGQEGRQPWLLTSEVYNKTTVQTAKYLQKPKGEALPVIFNFRPAAARVGNKYVLSSSLDLAKKLIDNLEQPQPRAAESRDLLLEVHGAAVAEALAVNNDHLVAQGIREGKTAERARADVEFFLMALRYIDSVRLTSQPTKGGYSIRFESNLK